MGIMRVSNRSKALYLDFDFKLPSNVNLKRVTFQDLDFENIQKWVVNALEMCNHIPKRRSHLEFFSDCLILQRDEDIDPETRKFGLHVEFPFLVLDSGSKLVECMKHIGMGATISVPHENSIEACLDNCMNKAWYLYGSGKKSNDNLYQITHICEFGKPPIPYNKSINVDILNFFKKHKISHWNGTQVSMKKTTKIESMLIFLLDPAHFSKQYLPEFHCVFNREQPDHVQNDTIFLNDVGGVGDQATIEPLLETIDITWATERNKWITMGFALKKYFKHNDDRGLQLFDKFSKRCEEKYNEHETTSTWNSLNADSTAHSNDLLQILKGRRQIRVQNTSSVNQLNPINPSNVSFNADRNVLDNYQSLLFKLQVSILPCLCIHKIEACQESLIFYERIFSLSDPLKPYGHEMFKWFFEELIMRRVIKLPQRENVFVVFNGHSVWKECNLQTVTSTLQSQIHENILMFQCEGTHQKNNIFDIWFAQLEAFSNIPQDLDRVPKQQIHKKLLASFEGKEIHAMRKACYDPKTLESVMKSIRFEIDDLIQRSLAKINNENLGIFPFANGVFDMYTGMFRNSGNWIRVHKKLILENQLHNVNEPIDRLQISEIFTHSTNYDFEEINEDDVDVVMAFLRDVFPSDEILQFFLDILSESTFGRNFHNKIVQMIGKGANGKSTLTRLLELAFGELFQAMSSSATSANSVKKQTGGPDSFLMQITKDHVRLITMADIPNFDFDHSLLKKLSGLDQIPVRELWCKAVTRICGALILLGGNSVIRLTAMEPSMVRRLIFIPCTTSFVSQSDFDAMSPENRGNFRIKKDIAEDEMRKMGKTLMIFLCKRLSDRIRVAKENESIRTLEIPLCLKQYQEDCIFRTTNFLEFVKTRFVRSTTMTTLALDIREAFLTFEKAPHGKHENLTPEMVENMLESVFERVQSGNKVYFRISHIPVL